jgi:hypothetical protein
MNMRVPLDYSVLDKYVEKYLDAVKEDLPWWKVWR